MNNADTRLPAGTVLAIVSAGILSFEICLTRIFSIQHWHHLSAGIIALVLLGFGSSASIMAVFAPFFSRYYRLAGWLFIFLFLISIPLSMQVANSIPFNMLALPWQLEQLGYLAAIVLCFLTPFFFGGAYIALIFMQMSHVFGRLYAVDLLGAATGICLVLLLLESGSLENAILLSMTLAGLGLCMQSNHWPQRLLSGVVALCLIYCSWQFKLINVYANDFKELPVQLAQQKARLEWQRDSSNARLSLVSSPAQHSAPGLSINSVANLPDQWHLFADGDSRQALLANVTNFNALRESLLFAPYLIASRRPNVVVLPSNQHWNAWTAIAAGAERVDLISDNRDYLKLFTTPNAIFDQFRLPELVEGRVSNPRAFFERGHEKYDLIVQHISNYQYGGASQQINYGVTREALRQMWRKLTPSGVIGIFVRQSEQPREQLKIISTLAAALGSELGQLSHHLIVLRDWNTSAILVTKSPLQDTHISHIKAWSKRWAFDIDALPGLSAADTNKFHVKPDNLAFHAIQALLEDGAGYQSNYLYQIQPATDDQPFFHHFFRWQSLPQILEQTGERWPLFVGWGYLLSLACLAVMLVLAWLLILLPLCRQPLRQAVSGNTLACIRYFACLGLGFMLVEMQFIFLFRRILDTATLAFAAVILGMLIGTGTGSFLVHRFKIRSDYLKWFYLCLALMVLLISHGIELFIDLTNEWSISMRFGLVAIVTLTPAILMGLFLPIGIRLVRTAGPGVTAWAWGINGFASVAGVMLTPLLAIHFGFTTIMLVALCSYLLAVLSLPKSLGVNT